MWRSMAVLGIVIYAVFGARGLNRSSIQLLGFRCKCSTCRLRQRTDDGCDYYSRHITHMILCDVI